MTPEPDMPALPLPRMRYSCVRSPMARCSDFGDRLVRSNALVSGAHLADSLLCAARFVFKLPMIEATALGRALALTGVSKLSGNTSCAEVCAS